MVVNSMVINSIGRELHLCARTYWLATDALKFRHDERQVRNNTGEGESMVIVEQSTIDTAVLANDIAATEAVTAHVVDEFLRVRENEIGLSMFTGGSQEVVEDDASDLESAIDDLADDVFGQWS